jgi:hypothetical protein
VSFEFLPQYLLFSLLFPLNHHIIIKKKEIRIGKIS